MSDVRPIFGNRVEDKPIAATIVHTLKLAYHDAKEVREFFVALDGSSLDRLSDLIERAKRKAASLKATLIDGSGTHYLRARRGRLRRESDFTALAEKWLAETAYESSLPRIVMHPAYQQIIGMGHEALGLILKWVQEGRPSYWFWALETIARETPVTEEMAGRTREMKAAWLKWGRQNGLVQESAPQSRDPRESRTGADC